MSLSRPYLPIAGLVLLILLAALLFPGMLNMDSAGMLDQAMRGQFNDWHSPAVSLLWRGLNHLYPGPASLLTLGLALFVAGGCWFARAATANLAAGIAAMLLLCLWPPILNDLSLVGKDQAFIACLMPFIALVCQVKNAGRLTSPMLALLAVLLFAACAIRQDSALCLLPALVMLYRLPLATRSKGFGWGLAGTLAILSVVLGLGLASAFNRLVARAYVTFPIQTTLVHDLAGISARADLYQMPSYTDPRLDLAMVKARYSPVTGDPLLFDMQNPIVKIVAAPDDVRELERAWANAVLNHPRPYLEHRAATFAALLGLEPPQDYQLYQPNTDETGARWHHLTAAQHIKNPHNALLTFYRGSLMPALLPSPIFRGYAYDLAILLEIGLALFRRRGPHDAVILALGSGALLHQAALLFASPAALFRYLYPSVLMLLAMTILTIAKPPAPEMSLGAPSASG